MPSVLLNTTSMSTVVTAPMLIHFMGISMVTTYSYLFYYRNPEVICFYRLPYKPCQFVENSWHSQIQQSAFQIQWWTQLHNDQIGLIYQCTGIAFPVISLCQSCQPGSVHWVVPDDGSGHWTIHYAHLSGYGPVGCRNASCEPIELNHCRSK